MVNAELSHNPFLLETKVLFNGYPPRVNSAIRKHENQALSDWVQDVPKIFHDEMNGYGFALYFMGTVSDFESVTQAFRDAGVPEQSVRIYQKGALKSADEKREAVLGLLQWLRDNPSRWFDAESFLTTNSELLDDSFPLLLLHGESGHEPMAPMTFESVDTVEELDGADLSNTPLLVFVTPETQQLMNRDLGYLLKRQDVSSDQLFFAIHPALSKSQVVRVLKDLGVRDPHVVTSANDAAITAYVQSHPVTAYVRDAIRILTAESGRISSELALAGKQSKRMGAKEEAKIAKIEREINRLKEADDSFGHLAAFDGFNEFDEVKKRFCDSISKWRNRLRKIEGEADAQVTSGEYESSVWHDLKECIDGLDDATKTIQGKIDKELASIYGKAEIDPEFRPGDVELSFTREMVIPQLREALLSLRETKTVEQKSDFFGFFGGTAPADGQKVTIVSYYMDKWREKAIELFDPFVDSLIKVRVDALRTYRDAAANSYCDHIAGLIAARRAKKENAVAKLSDEERLMQADNDWLTTFNDMLQDIRRG